MLTVNAYVKLIKYVNNLRRLLNDVLMGGCIPNEWKESRVVLVHKGGKQERVEKLSTSGNY